VYWWVTFLLLHMYTCLQSISIPSFMCIPLLHIRYTTNLKDNAGTNFFLFSKGSRSVLGSTQSPIQSALGALSLVVMWLGHKADQSPLSSAKVKKVCRYTFIQPSWYAQWQLFSWPLAYISVCHTQFYTPELGAVSLFPASQGHLSNVFRNLWGCSALQWHNCNNITDTIHFILKSWSKFSTVSNQDPDKWSIHALCSQIMGTQELKFEGLCK